MIDIENLELPEGFKFGLPESDYVRRGDAVAAIRKACIMQHIPFSSASPEGKRTLEAIQAVRTVEAADVAPVVHARWIENQYGDGDCYYTCSACKCDWTTICGSPSENNMKYCPECGAKMDGEEEKADV